MGLKVDVVPFNLDNYVFILKDEESGQVAVVDPGEATPVIEHLEANGIDTIDYIFVTHHHPDHIDGISKLQEKYDCAVYGNEAEKHRIPQINRALLEGEVFSLGETKFTTIFVPGHTSGHIAFYSQSGNALFCGDTLFSMGCGRLFEGSHDEMLSSLLKLRQLPEETKIYCAHEYTLQNGEFALRVDPENNELKSYLKMAGELRSEGKPTIPTTFRSELKTNPFLRVEDPGIRKTLDLQDASNLEVFIVLRSMKDQF